MLVRVALSGVLALAFLAPPAPAPAADDAAESGGRLEEVVVTAQKRSESLQVVPISAQVVGSAVLHEQNFNDLQDLTQLVPDVHISTGHAANDMYIRGVGAAGENPTYEQSVSVFIDDIYHGRSRETGATFLDLDRIEVLKGPQSAFFGNNAIAGALNIVTAKPGNQFDAWGRALYGMFGQYALEGAVSGPIMDTFGARLAVTRNGDDRGWIFNANTNQETPTVNNGAIRLTLMSNPLENLDATLKTEASQHRTSGAYEDLPQQWINCPPPSPVPPGFGAPPGGGCAGALAFKVPLGFKANANATIPGQYNSLSTFEEVLTVNYRLWDHVLTSVTGFYNFHFKFNADLEQLPVAIITNQNPESYHQFSQELRVASPVGRQIEYLAGIYFQTDHLETDGESNLPFLTPAFQNSPFAPYLPLGAQQTYLQSEHVYSGFGSLSWNAVEGLKLSAGLRGSWVNKDVNQSLTWGTGTQVYGGFVPSMPAAVQQFLSPIAGPPGAHAASVSNHAWMPSAALQYQLNQAAMAYMSYTRGFLAGGVDFQEQISGPTPGALTQYGPEYVNAYEAGIKSKWLQGRLLLNLDVFRSNYSDLQDVTNQRSTIGVFSQVTNAAASRSQGVEVEAQWIFAPDFRISINATYLDSYFVSFANGPATTLAQLSGALSSDLSGAQTPYAPKWSASINAIYGVQLPGGYRFVTQLNPYFSSSYFTIAGDPLYQVPGYGRLDGRLSLEGGDGHWAIDLVGKNLTNRDIIAAFSGISFFLASKEQPRNAAVQFRYRFR